MGKKDVVSCVVSCLPLLANHVPLGKPLSFTTNAGGAHRVVDGSGAWPAVLRNLCETVLLSKCQVAFFPTSSSVGVRCRQSLWIRALLWSVELVKFLRILPVDDFLN